MHVNSFIDDNIFDLAHLNEGGDFTPRGVARGHLDAQRADNQEGLVIHLHKVNVQHHAQEGDENSPGQNSRVLCEEEHRVSQQPHAAGVHHHLTDGDFRGAHSELAAEAGVLLAVQRDGFTTDVCVFFVLHCVRSKNDVKGQERRACRLQLASS